MASSDSPTTSFARVLQLSSALQDLTNDVAAYSEEFGSNNTTTGWTAINRPSDAEVGSSADNTADHEHVFSEFSSVQGEEVDIPQDGIGNNGERDTLLTFGGSDQFLQDVATGVYMENAQAGSWSGTLAESELWNDHQIRRYLGEHYVFRAQQNENARVRGDERLASGSSYTTDGPTTGFDDTNLSDYDDARPNTEQPAVQIDQLLRQDIELIKKVLQGRYVLTLDHTGGHDVDDNMYCRYRGCSYITADSYYMHISFPGREELTCRYCLECFEDMWNGELLIGALPDPRVLKTGPDGTYEEGDRCACHGDADEHEKQANELDADFPGGDLSTSGSNYLALKRRDSVQQPSYRQSTSMTPPSLLASKHAPKPDELAASAFENSFQVSKKGAKEPRSRPSALRSTLQAPYEDVGIACNCGRFPPTRFQHLAHYIQHGKSLNAVEDTVLKFWKARTEQQFRCMAKASTSALQGEIGAIGTGHGGLALDMAEQVTGLKRLQCVGRDLSEVLALTEARDDD